MEPVPGNATTRFPGTKVCAALVASRAPGRVHDVTRRSKSSPSSPSLRRLKLRTAASPEPCRWRARATCRTGRFRGRRLNGRRRSLPYWDDDKDKEGSAQARRATPANVGRYQRGRNSAHALTSKPSVAVPCTTVRGRAPPSIRRRQCVASGSSTGYSARSPDSPVGPDPSRDRRRRRGGRRDQVKHDERLLQNDG